MELDPVVRDEAGLRIEIADRPADSAHLADADEIGTPDLVAGERTLDRFTELRSARGISAAALFHVVEVILMQHHAVVLEAQASSELGVGGHFFFVDLAVGQNGSDTRRQIICRRDVPFVQLEVHLQRFVGDSDETAEIELLWFVDSCFHARNCVHELRRAAEGRVHVRIVAAKPIAEAAADELGRRGRRGAFQDEMLPIEEIGGVIRIRRHRLKSVETGEGSRRPLPSIADEVVHSPRAVAFRIGADGN